MAGVGPAAGGAADAELVALALSGNQAGFAALLGRYRDAVYRLVHSHLGDHGEALDVTQESFIAAFAALDRYDPARPFKAWVLRVALNKCRDWQRRRMVRRLFTFARPLDDALGVADSAPDPEVALASAQEVTRLRTAMAALPGKLKDPLILCALEGLSQDEAAAVLGVSRKTVETRIYRARQKLTQMLEGLA
ncbi:MAG: RNA polymerase sigma factor [Novosphingobium sp.]